MARCSDLFSIFFSLAGDTSRTEIHCWCLDISCSGRGQRSQIEKCWSKPNKQQKLNKENPKTKWVKWKTSIHKETIWHQHSEDRLSWRHDIRRNIHRTNQRKVMILFKCPLKDYNIAYPHEGAVYKLTEIPSSQVGIAAFKSKPTINSFNSFSKPLQRSDWTFQMQPPSSAWRDKHLPKERNATHKQNWWIKKATTAGANSQCNARD